MRPASTPDAPMSSPCDITTGASTTASTDTARISPTQAAMIQEAGTAVGGSPEIRCALNEFARAANRLQQVLPAGSEVHCFISEVPNNDGAMHLYTLVSATFHKALEASSRGSIIVSHAIRDAFLLARRSIQNMAQPASEVQEVQERPEFTLPEWFPWNRASEGTELAPRPIRYIFCRENVMREFQMLDINELAYVYATFFQALWAEGHKKRLVASNVTYAKMTPPWLRHSVTFMHGANRSFSLPFVLRVLPTKNQIRRRNGKLLGAAILDTWMKFDESSVPFILSVLREKHPNADFNNGACDAPYHDLAMDITPEDPDMPLPNFPDSRDASPNRTALNYSVQNEEVLHTSIVAPLTNRENLSRPINPIIRESVFDISNGGTIPNRQNASARSMRRQISELESVATDPTDDEGEDRDKEAR